MAPTESWKEQDFPLLDDCDNIDILASLLGNCDDIDDDDFENVFECFVSDEPVKAEETLSCDPSPQALSLLPHARRETADCSPTMKPVVFKSPSAGSNKQSLYRQNAINRWLVKRERRVFVKKVATVKASVSKKVVPNRSGSNGRFVKSTCGFISITQVQNTSSADVEVDDDFY